jgi:hypothetical protein
MNLVKLFPQNLDKFIYYTHQKKDKVLAGGFYINITRDIFILILSLSGIATASTIKAVKDQSDFTGDATIQGDYIKAIQEMAEQQIGLALSLVYDMLESGNAIAFASDPKEKDRALVRLEASNKKLDELATEYQKNLETLQKKMEKQMKSLSSSIEVTMGADESLPLDSFTLTVKEVRFEQLPSGQTNNKVLLALVEGMNESYVWLKGGEEFTHRGYTIKYVSLIFNEEAKRMEATLRIAKSSL